MITVLYNRVVMHNLVALTVPGYMHDLSQALLPPPVFTHISALGLIVFQVLRIGIIGIMRITVFRALLTRNHTHTVNKIALKGQYETSSDVSEQVPSTRRRTCKKKRVTAGEVDKSGTELGNCTHQWTTNDDTNTQALSTLSLLQVKEER